MHFLAVLIIVSAVLFIVAAIASVNIGDESSDVLQWVANSVAKGSAIVAVVACVLLVLGTLGLRLVIV